MRAAVKIPSLIITIKLDEYSQHFFNTQRRLYYPAHANKNEAHLTFFHSLPNNNFVLTSLKNISDTNSFKVEVTRLLHQPGYIAFSLKSQILQELHGDLQIKFYEFLSIKDRQPLKPHISIQSQVTAYKAQKLFETIQVHFEPFFIDAVGFCIWEFYQRKMQLIDELLFQDLF